MTEENKNQRLLKQAKISTEGPMVTVNDLVNVYNIIDLASKRRSLSGGRTIISWCSCKQSEGIR